jgi:hypothetical protein
VRRCAAICLAAAALFLAGCATTAWNERLFFGRAIPGGGEVSEAQWQAFVAEVILPRFPEGFTIWIGAGHWRGDDGVSVSEQAWVLEVVHQDDPSADAKLAEVARAYRERFNQDAVMRVRQRAEVNFIRRPDEPR